MQLYKSRRYHVSGCHDSLGWITVFANLSCRIPVCIRQLRSWNIQLLFAGLRESWPKWQCSLRTAEPWAVFGGRQEGVDAVVVALRTTAWTLVERGTTADATVKAVEPEVVAEPSVVVRRRARSALQVDVVLKLYEVVIVVEFKGKVTRERKPEGTRLLPELRLVPHRARHMHTLCVVTGEVAT